MSLDTAFSSSSQPSFCHGKSSEKSPITASVSRLTRHLVLVTSVVMSMLALIQGVHATESDPFSGGVWSAVKGGWPGTVIFNGNSHEVVLRPVGADAIHATYSYTIKSAASAGSITKGVLKGSLIMKTKVGQISESNFRLENGNVMALSFSDGRTENYQRLTPAEELAEKRRIQKLLEKK